MRRMREPPERLFTPAFLALTAADLAYFTAAGVLIGVTPFFAAGPLGAGAAGVGLAVGAFSVTTLVLRPLAGRWTDRYGRRPLLIGGAGIFAVMIAGHLLVTGLGWLVGLRLVLGAAEALFFVAGFAALADLAPPGRAGEALSYNSLALYVGIASGPLVGQALLGWGGFGLVWVGAGLFALVAAALAARVPETRQPSDAVSPPAPLIHAAVLVPGLGLFTGVAAGAGFLAFGALRAADLGLDAWSVVLLVYGAVVVTCRILFAKLPDRVRPLRMAAGALATCALGLVVVAVVPTSWGVLAGAAVLGLGTGFLTPAVFVAIFAMVPSSERGSAAGTASVFIDLGLGGGPMIVGFVAAGGGIPAGLLAAAALAVTGGALLRATPAAGIAGPG